MGMEMFGFYLTAFYVIFAVVWTKQAVLLCLENTICRLRHLYSNTKLNL